MHTLIIKNIYKYPIPQEELERDCHIIIICNSIFNMPTKMAKFCREKGVLIAMYEEKPRQRSVSPSQRQHQHHYHDHHLHHHHHYLHHASAGKEYNRRAELLRYSERLRESARPDASTLLPPNPTPPNNQQPQNKIIAVLKKQNSARTPNCLGNCKISMPSFIRSLTSPKDKKASRKKKQSGLTNNKMKALMKSFQEQKKSGFIAKLFSTSRKRR